MRSSTKKGNVGSVRLACKNGLASTLIIAMLLCRKLYIARSKFDKIVMYTNNVSKTQMLSHVRHYLEASFYPFIKRGDMCGANV